jgi:hypothetical protein
MREGKGGQQKRQQRSRMDSVFIVRSSGKKNERDINNKRPRNTSIDAEVTPIPGGVNMTAMLLITAISHQEREEGEKQACCRFLRRDEYMQRCFLTTSASSRSSISVSEVKSEETCWVTETIVLPEAWSFFEYISILVDWNECGDENNAQQRLLAQGDKASLNSKLTAESCIYTVTETERERKIERRREASAQFPVLFSSEEKKEKKIISSASPEICIDLICSTHSPLQLSSRKEKTCVDWHT